MISVCKTVVSKIMANRTHAKCEGIKFAQLRKYQHRTLGQEYVAHLKDIHGVHIIVVLNVTPVTFVDLTDETGKFGLVHLGQLVDVEHLHDVDGQHRQRGFSTEVPTELQGIKGNIIGASKMHFVFLDIVVNCTQARGATLQ